MEVFRFLLEFIGSASGPLAYSLVFGVLVACGLGLPLPEDVALITGGFLVHKGQADLGLMLAVGFAGILAGDSLVFLLGRLGRRARGRRPGGLLARHLTADRIAKVEAQFEKRGSAMILIARFLPGVRAATYFVAGGAKMSYGRFILFDGIAALLSAPIFVLLGHHFGKQIHHVIGWAEEFHKYLIAATLLVLLVFTVRWLLTKGPLRTVGAGLALPLRRFQAWFLGLFGRGKREPAQVVPLERLEAAEPVLPQQSKASGLPSEEGRAVDSRHAVH